MVATEFAGLPDEDVVNEETGAVTRYGLQSYFLLFADEVSCRRFGKYYPKALAYLTAHKLKMLSVDGSEDGTSGTSSDGLGNLALGLRISSASEGETSVSFRDISGGSGTSDADADYKLTQYGVEYSVYLPLTSKLYAPQK